MVCLTSLQLLTKAHNLAWKLAAVIKGQAVDPDKLLDSYTEEVIRPGGLYLTTAHSCHSQNNCINRKYGSWYDGRKVMVLVPYVHGCLHCRRIQDYSTRSHPNSSSSNTIRETPLITVKFMLESNCRWCLIGHNDENDQTWNNVAGPTSSNLPSNQFSTRPLRNNPFAPSDPRLVQTYRTLLRGRQYPSRTPFLIPEIRVTLQTIQRKPATGHPRPLIPHRRDAQTELVPIRRRHSLPRNSHRPNR